MRRSTFLAVFIALVVSLNAHAQLSVQLKMDRDSLLLFESIPVIVNVRNFSGRTIELSNQDGAPWLSFVISDEAGATISALGNQFVADAVKIAPGSTVSLTVNLLPHYDLRQRGGFIARAVVAGDGTQVMSAPVNFSIMNGQEIWKQTIGLPPVEGQTNEEYRTYSLQLRRTDNEDVLYVSVQDVARSLVYGVIPLGEFITMGEPSARADNAGYLHVLYRSGPRSISYAYVGPDAKVIKRVIYSDVLSVPQLVTDKDGVVTVHGGEQVYPHVERVMSEEELKPRQPPPPKPQKKKKWWWPFGSGSTQPQTTNGTTSATSTNTSSANVKP
jgi:hypothetical protein